MLKTLKSNRKLGIITAIISITFIWMASGIFTAKNKSEVTNISTENKVQSIDSESALRRKYLSFSAVGLAFNRVSLIPQITGQVTKIFVRDGDSVKAGDKIVQLTNEYLVTRVMQMNDGVESANLQYHAAKELWKKNLGSELNIDNAKTALKIAEADLATAKNALDNSIIIAPFDGVIDELNVQEGDIISNIGSGYNNIGKLIDLQSIQAQAYLSQSERNQILENKNAVIIKSSNETIPATITFISQSADDQTGTFLVKAVGENLIKIADGEQVTLKIQIGDIKSHNVPISALLIDNAGDLAANTIDANNQLQQFKVTLVDEDDKGVWISGLPDKCKIVLASQ